MAEQLPHELARRWAMVRLGPGDYLLPSNDRQTIWRLYRYDEDGTLEQETSAGEYRQVCGSFWGLARWTGMLDQLDPTWDSERWAHVSGLLSTRAEAIREALRREPPDA